MAKKHSSGKTVTEKDFVLIKTLLNAGVPASKIMDISGRAAGTVSSIRRSETLEDYHRINREYRERMKVALEEEELVPIKLTEIEVSPELPIQGQIDILNAHIEGLNRVNDKQETLNNVQADVLERCVSVLNDFNLRLTSLEQEHADVYHK